MGFKISEKFKECLGNALSAIIRVFLYFVIFEEKVNAVVYPCNIKVLSKSAKENDQLGLVPSQMNADVSTKNDLQESPFVPGGRRPHTTREGAFLPVAALA